MVVIARVIPAAFACCAFLGSATRLLSQNTEVDAVKRVIRAETDAYYRHDADAWKATWIQDSTAIRTIVGSGGYGLDVGWDKFGRPTVEALQKNPTPEVVEVRESNYVVRTDGALAWAEYDQRLTTPADTMPYVSREQRTLVKRNGDWKILSAGTYDWWSYGTFQRAVEFRLNSLGAALTDAKNYRDAIEVLKLSAQLTPSSPRVYHRLGVAYAAAGETKLAIENYEKSLAIDPKNELGRVALAKLREGKAP